MLDIKDCRNAWFHELARIAAGQTDGVRQGALDRLRPLFDLDRVVVLTLLCYFAGYGDERQVNHVLLEGINGLSKTQLASQINSALLGPALRAYYDLVGSDPYQRTAGSPDQTPADILGADVLGGEEQGRGRQMVFQAGPMLRRCLVYYADELNRSPPKTQAVLLEAMAEKQVTITTLDTRWRHRRIRRLPWFWLLASQNPEFHEGTFPLPEAQLDRFMVKITMPYTTKLEHLLLANRERTSPPDRGDVFEIELRKIWPEFEATAGISGVTPGQVRQICQERRTLQETGRPARSRGTPRQPNGLTAERIEIILQYLRQRELDVHKRAVARDTEFPTAIAEYVARLVYSTWSEEATRLLVPNLLDRVSTAQEIRELVSDVAQGCSPRAAIALRDLGCAVAWSRTPTGQKAVVNEDDIDAIAPYVLQHRLALRFQSMLSGGQSPERLIEQLVAVFRWQRR
jgi:MoxR-like ATPase